MVTRVYICTCFWWKKCTGASAPSIYFPFIDIVDKFHALVSFLPFTLHAPAAGTEAEGHGHMGHMCMLSKALVNL
eukprot:scaffold55007_cov22-Tisochrysis_lutea.AAC.3